MTNHWSRWTAGILAGLTMTALVAACESKKSETSQAPADESRSMAAGPAERRDMPVTPAPDAEQRPGAAKPDKQRGAAG